MKWILRYLRGTSDLKLCFRSGKLVITSYTDANMVGDGNTRKSTLGYLITFAGEAVSWKSRLQKYVALSTTKAKFIAVIEHARSCCG